jgi:hypothetical protein
MTMGRMPIRYSFPAGCPKLPGFPGGWARQIPALSAQFPVSSLFLPDHDAFIVLDLTPVSTAGYPGSLGTAVESKKRGQVEMVGVK